MPNLLSTGTAFAGKFENAPTGISGEQVLPLPDTAVTVYQSDGSTLATLFADETKATTASNPVTTDNYGNLTFYANPGIYVLSYLVQGIATTQTVEVGPWYTDGAWNVYAETAAVTANSGDSVLANVSSAAFAVTTPAPVVGARLLVTKTDSSANAVSVTTPTGVIDGPTGITGIGTATIQLGTQGESAEIHCDGTNWHLVGGGGTTINPNLLFNSTGEHSAQGSSAIDGWSFSSGGFEVLTAQGNSGGLAQTSPAVLVDIGNNDATETLTSAQLEAGAGETFTLSGYASQAGTGQGTGSLAIQAYNGSSWSNISGASVNLPANTAAAFYSCSGTTPSGTTAIRVVWNSAEGTASTANNVWLLKLEKGSVATPWQPSVVGQPWTSYTPTFGGVGNSLGNGSLTGRYRFLDAKTMVWELTLNIGSTTVIGSNPVTLSAPPGVAFPYEQWLPGRWFNGVFYNVGLDNETIYQPISSSSSQLQTLDSGSGMIPGTNDNYLFQGIVEVE